jgi:hypothetical protein
MSKNWTPADKEKLKKLTKEGLKPEEIALRLKASTAEVQAKLKEMGLLK